MRVGTKGGGFAGDAADPIVLSDVFARVGGPDGLDHNVGVETMVEGASVGRVKSSQRAGRVEKVVKGRQISQKKLCQVGANLQQILTSRLVLLVAFLPLLEPDQT
jgi:hypothetical protein